MSHGNNNMHTLQINPSNEIHSEDSCDSGVVTLTNAAVFLHENSNRIECELQCLEEQVNKLQELDGILENVRRELQQMTTMRAFSNGSNHETTRQQTQSNSSSGQSATMSCSSDCAVWDDSNSVTTVAHNY
jgi:hypothetical protein